MSRLTLTGNDLALAEMGLIHAERWHRGQQKKHGRNGFTTAELTKLKALREKLSAIGEHAYPYEGGYDEIVEVPHYGDEPILRMDPKVVKATRAKARRYNSKVPS